MTGSREVLIEAMARAMAERHKAEELVNDSDPEIDAKTLDAILAHPVAVLCELESAPCPTCDGTGEGLVGWAGDGRNTVEPCDGCGGSGRLGRDGVLRALGMEQVGVVASEPMMSGERLYFTSHVRPPQKYNERTAWAASRVAVPPKETTTDE
jgi:hypothetical protein